MNIRDKVYKVDTGIERLYTVTEYIVKAICEDYTNVTVTIEYYGNKLHCKYFYETNTFFEKSIFADINDAKKSAFEKNFELYYKTQEEGKRIMEFINQEKFKQ